MGVDCNLKVTYTPYKPQNQGRWTKEEEMEARTLPLDVRRMRESRIYVCVCVNLGEKRERELIQKMLQMPKISFFFGILGGGRVFIVNL